MKSLIGFAASKARTKSFMMALTLSFAFSTMTAPISRAQGPYSVNGTVSGLTPGATLTLQVNGNPPFQISSDGVFTYPTLLANNTTYTVTLGSPPPPGETCVVANGSGAVNGGAVNSIIVTCQAASGWTPLANKAPGGAGTMLLLSDGSVLVNTSYTAWSRLVPDNTGHYIHGTWTSISNSNCPHGDFASQVLMDGRVFIAGGESPNPPSGAPGCAGPGQANSGVDTEIYDPVANVWTMANPPTSLIDPTQKTNFPSLCGTQAFADMTSETLPNGNVLMAPVCPKNCGDTLIFNSKSFSPSSSGSGWSFGGTLANTGGNALSCNEQETSWVKLQDGSILTADPPVQPGALETSERYVPSLNKWFADTSLGFTLFNTEFGYNGDGEEGPAFLLPNGTAIFIGGDPARGIYTPGAPPSPGSPPVVGAWTQGSLSPNGPATGGAPLSADDAPGAMMIDGNILLALNFAAIPNDVFPRPVSFYEYSPTQNTFIEVLGPGNPGAPSPWTDCGPTTMLDLPDGTVLMPDGCDGTQLYVYQPNGPPLAQGKPSIISITPNANGSYLLTGTGLNGISEGGAIGDDVQMASNYPLVRLTDGSGKVIYARTHDWSTAGVMTGATQVSTEFSLPTSILLAPWQNYSLQVVANGNPSNSTSFAAGTKACIPSCARNATCGESNGCGGSCPGSCRFRWSCKYYANTGYRCVESGNQ